MTDRKPTRAVAFMNQKGGVGKTTTTVNLAAAIARTGRRTLIVDLDPQAHATLHLGIDPASIDQSVYDLLLDPAIPLDGVCQNIGDNLRLIPAETDLAAIESELANEPDKTSRLQRVLAERDDYEFIAFDCPPSLGILTLNALAAAREVIIPMQAHFLALQGVGKLLETVGLVTQSVNPTLTVTGVILCMHDSQSTHSREVVADLDSFFDEARGTDLAWRFANVYRPPIRRNIKLAECPSFGQTIFDYAPGCPGAQDYEELAAGVVGEWDAVVQRQLGGRPGDSVDVVVKSPGQVESSA